jgi:UDP-2-acetamido-3-amino-2,3-dideoxy-glucuronate N-acetyltransferase
VLAACEQALRSHHVAAEPVKQDYFAHESAWIDAGAHIGAGTKIWHATHVMERARIGRDCSFGQNCFVASDVQIGDRVKVQNNVSVYTGVYIEDDVFLGPSCVFTNVTNPRSQVDRRNLYESTRVRRGASIGANATIRCGVEIGRYAFVGAGAVVTKNVPDYALVVGVPAEQVGWMSRHGHRLEKNGSGNLLICPESGFRYEEKEPGVLRCLDVDEDQPLPPEKRVGKASYESFQR